MVYRVFPLPAMVLPLGQMPHAMARHLAICRQMVMGYPVDHFVSATCGRDKDLTDSKHSFGDRGAVGRVLCLPIRALRSGLTSELLQKTAQGQSSVGADKKQALVRSCTDWIVVAGAMAVQGMANFWHASFRASPFEGGSHLPPKPCMNELPAHAPNSIDCNLHPYRLHARTNCSGFEKLYRSRQQRPRVSGAL